MLETQDSDSDDDSADLIEREFREGSNLEDIYFQDLSPGNITNKTVFDQFQDLCKMRLLKIQLVTCRKLIYFGNVRMV